MIGKAVLERFKALLGDLGHGDGGETRSAEAYQLAAAALLVEAAHMDENFDAQERAKILDLLTGRFALGASEGEELLAAAEAKAAESHGLYSLTKAIKDALDIDGRIGILEMLWELAYTDGQLHDYEASLIRRVTGLLHVSDRDSGAARKRALNRLGQGN